MTTEVPGECKGNVVWQHQTGIFSFYWGKGIGRLKWSRRGQRQAKTAIEDRGTRDVPPYVLLSSTWAKQVPMENLPA